MYDDCRFKTRFLFECESSQEATTVPYVHRAIAIIGARLE